jgi:hypothetical protein
MKINMFIFSLFAGGPWEVAEDRFRMNPKRGLSRYRTISRDPT